MHCWLDFRDEVMGSVPIRATSLCSLYHRLQPRQLITRGFRQECADDSVPYPKLQHHLSIWNMLHLEYPNFSYLIIILILIALHLKEKMRICGNVNFFSKALWREPIWHWGKRKLFGVAVEGRTHFQQAWKCGQKGRFLVRPLVSERIVYSFPFLSFHLY